MNRVRVSTTVDGVQLERCRRLLDLNDSQLLDRALAALIDEVEAAREVDALTRQPYEDDPDLTWSVPPAPALPYDGGVPAEVLRLAEERRRSTTS